MCWWRNEIMHIVPGPVTYIVKLQQVSIIIIVIIIKCLKYQR